jgi:hypothetical protein
MLAQRLLVDLQLLGDVGLSGAESRSALGERALVCGRHIFGGHFPFRVAQLRDARARGLNVTKSLKDNNRLYISLFVIMNALGLYVVAQTNTIAFSGFKALLTEATNILPVGIAFIVAAVSNGLLSADMKARLVFLRWNHALPGHRSFSKYAVQLGWTKRPRHRADNFI